MMSRVTLECVPIEKQFAVRGVKQSLGGWRGGDKLMCCGDDTCKQPAPRPTFTVLLQGMPTDGTPYMPKPQVA